MVSSSDDAKILTTMATTAIATEWYWSNKPNMVHKINSLLNQCTNIQYPCFLKILFPIFLVDF